MNTITTKFGYYSAISATIAVIGYGIVQILQILGFIVFPWDEILIYGTSLCIAAPYMFAVMALHHSVKGYKKIWSHAALLLAIMYAVYGSFVYVVQLGAVLPKTIRGEADGIQVLTMTQHSFFWTLDALTYICLGLSTLFAAFVFANHGFEKRVRWFCLANAFITPVIALVYFYPSFSIPLLLLGSPWIITAAGSMFMMARFFKKTQKEINIKYLIQNPSITLTS